MKSMMTLANRVIVRAAKSERKLVKSEAKLLKAEAKLQSRKGKVEAARKIHQAALGEAEQLDSYHSEATTV